MELQALRYAAMISTMSFAKACEYFQTYLKKQNCDADAKEKILEFVELDETELVDFGKDIRIVLASSDFSKELTTTAIWLRDKGVDIRCVRLTPYRFNDDVLINAEQIIPVPELEEYQVKFREKRDEQLISSQKKEKDYTFIKFFIFIYIPRIVLLFFLTANQWGIVNIELLIEFVRQNGFVVEKAEQ
ncbi:hypothetical protein ACT4US_20615, partial [Bacillus sp. HC-Mk]